MSLQDEIKNDWELVDGVEEITYAPRNPTASNVTQVKALQRAVNKAALALFGAAAFAPNTTIWELWEWNGSTQKAIAPKDGDLITTASSVVWRIENAMHSPQTSRYMCVCIKEIGAST